MNRLATGYEEHSLIGSCPIKSLERFDHFRGSERADQVGICEKNYSTIWKVE